MTVLWFMVDCHLPYELHTLFKILSSNHTKTFSTSLLKIFPQENSEDSAKYFAFTHAFQAKEFQKQ